VIARSAFANVPRGEHVAQPGVVHANRDTQEVVDLDSDLDSDLDLDPELGQGFDRSLVISLFPGLGILK
jgi:hypothetical protein